MENSKCYSIISLNSGGLKIKERLDTALQFCRNAKADFSILQETHLGPNKFVEIKNQWEGEVYISPGTTFRDGILLLAKATAPKLRILRSDPKGKYIIFRILNTNDVIINIYAPSGIIKEKCELRQNFFRNLNKQIDLHTKKEDNIILLGDFNTTLTPLDRSSGELGQGKSELENLIQKFNLEDNWRLQNPKEKLYTHYHGRTNTYSRIDRAYTNTKIRANIKIKHLMNSFSDHFHAVFVERNNQQLKRGKGYWILNSALLNDDNYIKEIEKLWNKWRSQKHCFSSVSQWWEKGKKHVRDFTKQYTRASTKELNKRKTSLEKRLRNIYKKIHRRPELQTMANNLRSELFKIEVHMAQGAKIRSRIRIELDGERCTRFFFQQVEKHKNAKQDMFSITSIKNGKLLTSQKEILDEVKEFYADLYAEKQTNNFCGRISTTHEKTRKQDEMLRKISKTVSLQNKQHCEQPFNNKEIRQAISTLENNKSPGNDGLTAEFYKTFTVLLQEDLKELFEEISKIGRMPESMRQAVITCIYKKGKMEDITNWRPISLLNYDYKILTKILANRLQNSLKDIISTEQTAAIKGRTIIENLQLNRDIISYANTNELEASIITLDQEKAFDRVDRKFLFKALRKFGYGPNIIFTIEAIYNNIEAQIKLNGNISQSFPVQKGVRQGCPLSMILYIILAEVTIVNIQKNENIKGIKVGQKEIKISAFADDTTLYIGHNSSFSHLKNQLQEIEQSLGVKYNRKKCFGLWLGKNRYNREKPLGFNWDSYEIKILGYIYGNTNENWFKVKSKIQKSINKWNNLKLSLVGKKTIINQVLLSKVWYFAYVESPPQNFLQEIRRDIYNFLWSYKKVRVNRITTTMPIKDGGLGIIDIETQCKAIKCAVLSKFLNDIKNDKQWTEIMLWHLNQFRDAKQGINLFKTYIPNTNRGNKQERFYKDLLTAWTDLTNNEKVDPITLTEIYNEPLFFNTSSTTQKDKSKYLLKKPPPWAREYFTTVGDICKKVAPGFISLEELLRANANKIVRYSPQTNDLKELIKLIPNDWKYKIEHTHAAIEESKIKVKHRTLKEKWTVVEVSTLKCKDFYNTIHFRKVVPMYQNRKYLKWQENKPDPLSQRQWNTLFINLYNKVKQKDSFDVRYKFLHFAQPTAIKLREIKQSYTDTTCPRCGEQEETHEHWLFSCPSSQNILMYLQSTLQKVYTDYSPPSDATDCLLTPLLQEYHQFPVAHELYELYFIHIRNIRKDATYGTLPPRQEQLLTFKENIQDRLNFLYKAAVSKDNLEHFLKSWKKLVTRNGKINLPIP